MQFVLDRITQISIFLIILLSILILRFSFILLKVILFLDLFPSTYLSSLFKIVFRNLITDLLSFLPFFFLLLWHNITFWRFIYFCFTDSINEAYISCLLAYINLPHLKFFLLLIFTQNITFLIIFILIILG